MIRLVIFDMDGVLIDSEDAITLAAQEALTQWGVHAQYDDFKQYTGMGENVFIGNVAQQYGVPFTPKMKDATYRIYCDTAMERVQVYPWSKPIIRKLRENGFSVAIASAADQTKVDCNIACIGLRRDEFASIITGSDVTRHKPHPDVFLLAAEKAGIDPRESLVIEDALSGVQAAKAAGMTCLALTTSFPEEKLRAVGADQVMDGLDDAFDWIKTL